MFLKKILFASFCLAPIFTKLPDTNNNKSKISQSTMKAELIKPPYLKKGDTVAIVAPSGVLINREKEILKATKVLESWGLNVYIGKHVFNKANHFAGTDKERAKDLQTAMDNPNIKAIWCARGGYGIVRILDRLDFTGFTKYPKWVIGYSDITALHSLLHNLGYESIHGMMCINFEDDNTDIRHAVSSLKKALFGASLHYDVDGNSYNFSGQAKGQLVGGNLTILQGMLGSNTSMNIDGKILFIEETSEYKYHIDRMLWSLKRAGYFENCAGVIVGNMSNIKPNKPAWGATIEQLIRRILKEYNFPVLFGFPAGHEKDNRSLLLGRKLHLVVEKTQGKVVFEK